MMILIAKYALTAFVIVLVSEIAKRTDKAGALISSLPFVTVIVMNMALFGKARQSKNRKSCLLHFLVRHPNATHVSCDALVDDQGR